MTKTYKLLKKLNRPYYIAELNTSHFGDLKIAKEMIRRAHQSGSDCVKLQSWTPESLYSKNYFKKNPIAERFYKKYSLGNKQLEKLSKFAKKIGIDFSSTTYTKQEVNFLVKNCNPAFIKIASMDLNNLEFLNHIGSKKIPVILSTGMGTLKEIEIAVKILKKSGNKELYILHCVSIYPTEPDMVNIKNITGLKRKFPNCVIGFSDHTIGSTFAISSVALGAKIIEKHFTLNSKTIGMDNNMATEPSDMKRLIDKCNLVYKGLGNEHRKISKEEKKQKLIMRRSIFSAKNLTKGHKLKREDLILKRPGTGIPANELGSFLGKKINKPIKKDQFLKLKYIK